MENHNNKINILKALAIMLVVSGHLEFSLIPGFPPYSFQIALFFFISGMLFNDKYSFFEYLKRRIKTLLIPYFLYAAFYLAITAMIAPVIDKFWAMPVTLKNELLMPFLTGHQIDLISPLWFVCQLFISLIAFYILNKIFKTYKLSKLIQVCFYFALSLCAIQLDKYSYNLYILLILRTMFSMLFIYTGYLYRNDIEQKYNIFNSIWFLSIIILEAFLWLTNADYTPMDGIGLSYILVWGRFDNWIIPVITSLTGIWISLFIVEICYNYIKDWSFIHKIGQNTYHIMANHIFIFNIITYLLLYIKGIPFDVKNNADIYWFYCPMKTTYFYFITGMILTTLFGELLKITRKKLIKS